MRHKKIIWILKLLVGVLLIGLIYGQVAKKASIVDAITSANPGYIFLGFILLIPNLLIQFLKWRYLLNGHFEDIDNMLVIKSLLFGATLGFVTPGNLGELGRGLYFKEQNKFVVTGLNILDKIFGMIIFITIGLVTFNIIIETRLLFSASIKLILHLVSLLSLLSIWIFVIHPAVFNRVLNRIGRKFSSEKVQLIISGLKTLSIPKMFFLSLLNTIWFLIILLQYHSIINAFAPVAFPVSFLAVGATLFTKIMLPISLGDLGVREGAAVFYFSLFLVPASAAFYTSFIIFIINFCCPALIGSFFVFQLKWEQKAAVPGNLNR